MVMRKVGIAVGISLALVATVVLWLGFLDPQRPEPLGTNELRPAVSDEDALGTARDAGSGRGADATEAESQRGMGDTNRLFGRVVDAFDAALPQATVYVRREPIRFDPSDGSFVDRLRDRLLRRAQVTTTDTVLASAETDSNGLYSINVGLFRTGGYIVYARHDAHAPEAKLWEKRADGDAELNFRLIEGQSIAGYVTDRSGVPIAGAEVAALEPRTRGFGPRQRRWVDRAVTTSSGSFVLTVPSGVFHVRASAIGYRRIAVDDVQAGTEDLGMTLPPAGGVTGRVVNTAGELLSGVEVALEERSRGRFGRRRPRPMRGAPAARTSTDEQGRFAFDEIPTRSFSLSFVKPGYVTRSWEPRREDVRRRGAGGDSELGEDIDEVPGVSETNPLEVVLETAAPLSGEVRDAFGDPVVGAFVAVARSGGDGDGPWSRGRRGRDRGEGRGRANRQRAESEDEEGASAERGVEPVSLFRALTAVETNANGRYHFDSLAPGVYDLSVDSPRHPVRRVSDLELESDGAEVDIELPQGITLEGSITSVEGNEPVAAAEISLRVSRRLQRRARTDDSGRFEIAGLVAGSLDEVVVRASGFSTAAFSDVTIADDRESQTLDLVMEPAATVAGRVVDAAGEGVFRAEVTMLPVVETDFGGWDGVRQTFRRSQRHRETTRTDSQGAFHFAEIDSGLGFRLQVTHPDYQSYVSEDFDVASGSEATGIELVLARGGEVVFFVTDPDSTPVAGARVRFELQQQDELVVDNSVEESGGARRSRERPGRDRGERRRRFERAFREFTGEADPLPSFRRSSGPDGTVRFAGLAAGDYVYSISHRGFQSIAGVATVAEESEQSVVAVLPFEHLITGVVVDGSGQPVGGAEVRARPVSVDSSSLNIALIPDRRQLEGSARSKEDGTFRIGQLAPGTYELRVRARGFVELVVGQVTTDTSLEIVLERYGSVSGQVFSGGSGLPLQRFRARLAAVEPVEPAVETERPSSRRQRRTARWLDFSRDDGSFSFTGVEPGTYHLEIAAPDHVGATLAIDVLGSDRSSPIQISLNPGVALAGNVFRRGGAGESVGDANIYLLRLEEDGGEDAEAAADTSARRRQQGGREERRGRLNAESREILPGPEEVAQRAALTLRSLGVGGANAVTADDGTFRIAEISAGRFLVVVDHEHFLPTQKEIQIADERAIPPLRFDLDAGAELSGRLVLTDDVTTTGATCLLRHASGLVRRTFLGSDGTYRFRGLLQGEHRLSVEFGAGAQLIQRQRVTINGSENRFDYRFDESAGER